MATNKVFLVIVFVCIFLAGILAVLFTQSRPQRQGISTENPTSYAVINDTRINLELAVTDAEKTKGLGYRDTLESNTGMLFVYDQPSQFTFWMQGMRFALDFIWIDNSRVEDIHENILPPTQTNNVPHVVSPKVPVRYILEVNTGFIKEHNIKTGDPVILKIDN